MPGIKLLLTALAAAGALLALPAGEARRDEIREVAGFEALPPVSGRYKLGAGPAFLVRNPDARGPQGPGLTIMTFNVYLGGRRRQELLSYFRALDGERRLPDVVALQETNTEVVPLLAREFGFHVAAFSREADVTRPLVNGKAILSRHAIREVAHHTYDVPAPMRDAAIRAAGKVGELDEDRGALRATVDLAGRDIDVFTVHHTLGSAAINARQVAQLTVLVKESLAAGRAVVVAGDFNANWNPDGDPLNSREPESHAALSGLLALVQDVWRPVVRPQQRTSGGLAPDPAGVSFVGLPDKAPFARGLRLDAILASSGLVPVVAEVDRRTAASDHVPVVAWFEVPGR